MRPDIRSVLRGRTSIGNALCEAFVAPVSVRQLDQPLSGQRMRDDDPTQFDSAEDVIPV